MNHTVYSPKHTNTPLPHHPYIFGGDNDDDDGNYYYYNYHYKKTNSVPRLPSWLDKKMAEGANPGWLETLESLDEFRVGPPSEGLRNVLRREDALMHEENQADGDSVADDDEGETFEQMLMGVAQEMRQESPFEKGLPYLEDFEASSNRLLYTSSLKNCFASCKIAREEGASVRVQRANANACLLGVRTLVKHDRTLQRGHIFSLDSPSRLTDFTTLPRRMEMTIMFESANFDTDPIDIIRKCKALLHLHKFYLVADNALFKSEVVVSTGGAREWPDPEVLEYFNAKEIMVYARASKIMRGMLEVKYLDPDHNGGKIFPARSHEYLDDDDSSSGEEDDDDNDDDYEPEGEGGGGDGDDDDDGGDDDGGDDDGGDDIPREEDQVTAVTDAVYDLQSPMVNYILGVVNPFLTPAQDDGTTGGEWLDDTAQLGGARCPPGIEGPFNYRTTGLLMRVHDEKVLQYINTTPPPGVTPNQMYNEAAFKKFTTGSRSQFHAMKIFSMVLKVGNIAVHRHYFSGNQISIYCKFRHLMWNRFLELFETDLHLELNSSLQKSISNRLDNQGRPSFHIPTRGYWERKCEELLETRQTRIEQNIIHGLHRREFERADFIARLPDGMEFAGPAPGGGWRMRPVSAIEEPISLYPRQESSSVETPLHSDTVWTEENGGELCSICQNNNAIMMLMPCGHLCVCYECSVLLQSQDTNKSCPLCRKTFTSTHRVYGHVAKPPQPPPTQSPHDYGEDVRMDTQSMVRFNPLLIKADDKRKAPPSTVTVEELDSSEVKVSLEEIDELTEGLQLVTLNKRQRTVEQQARLEELDQAATVDGSQRYTSNEDFWQRWNTTTGSEIILPSLYSYIQFRRSMDPQYDALGWSDMANYLFVDLADEPEPVLYGAVVNFVEDYGIAEADWGTMVREVQAWHTEYYRRLDESYNQSQKNKVMKYTDGSVIFRGCIQGLGLQQALFQCIDDARAV